MSEYAITCLLETRLGNGDWREKEILISGLEPAEEYASMLLRNGIARELRLIERITARISPSNSLVD